MGARGPRQLPSGTTRFHMMLPTDVVGWIEAEAERAYTRPTDWLRVQIIAMMLAQQDNQDSTDEGTETHG